MAEHQGWHVDKRVSVGHIITTLMVASAFFAWMTSIESSVSVNTSNIEHNTQEITDVKHAQDAQYAEIIRRLERIDDRLNQ